MKQSKYLFIDRDGTLIAEPEDRQIDHIDKLAFLPGVFSALEKLQQNGFRLVMVTNQDGLGSEQYPVKDFQPPHDLMMRIFHSQGIRFDDILICPHFPYENCACRKPEIGLVKDYLKDQCIWQQQSFVIGDRLSDMDFAENLGIQGLQIGSKTLPNWRAVYDYILNRPRKASIHRCTKETEIHATVNLDQSGQSHIQTGIGFYDHMLEQLAKHAGISLGLSCEGDVDVDDHHTVEDVAIVTGEVIRKALGDKLGIERYGFYVPMDEALAQVALDLSGRFYCSFEGHFTREKLGDLSTELIRHFFYSFAEGLKATLNVKIDGGAWPGHSSNFSGFTQYQRIIVNDRRY
jgi:imidazoleglycerol-phosphate dehydratase/histidinol-phosphatase